MELILKLPPNKHPFIGVVFDHDYEASEPNKMQFNNYQRDLYELSILPGEKLTLTLSSRMGKCSDKYVVNYNPVELLKFILKTRDQSLTFGHIYQKDGKLHVARTRSNMTQCLITVSKITG
jgi:hypothetical protein